MQIFKMDTTRLSLFFSLVILLEVLTFPSFFLINPFAQQLGLFMQIAQVVSSIGWVLIVVAPPLLWLGKNLIGKAFLPLFVVATMTWPLGLLLVRFASVITIGNPAINYLFTYPIFIFTDIVVPVVYWKMIKATASNRAKK